MSKLGNLGHKLHRGEISYDFVGKRKLWYGLSILITITAIIGLAVNGLKEGIEFSGGVVLTTQKTSLSVAEVQSKIAGDTGGHTATVQKLGNGNVRIQVAGLSTSTSNSVQQKVADDLGVTKAEIDSQIVGPSWGKDISNKALEGLIIFLVLVVIYLAIAFEWRMALAALIALLHDLTITTGVYAIVGFEVTPGTVIGLLTILGYSLYDTVVVFDGLKEATRDITKQNRFTYSDIANRSLNGTLVRSINTTIVALLPVGALLFIGGGILGAGMLNDIALALFVGLTAGAYSSIFIATPLVADFKERETQFKGLRKRVLTKRTQDAAKARLAAENGTTVEDDGDDPDIEDATPAGVAGPRTSGSASAAGRAAGSRPARNQPTNRNNRGRGRSSGKRR